MPPDTNSPLPAADPTENDDEVERVLLEAAIQEALDDPSPSIPHEVVREEILQDITRLRAAMPEQAGDGEEAERRALETAVQRSRADPRPNIPHAVVRARMVEMIAEADARIAAARRAAEERRARRA